MNIVPKSGGNSFTGTAFLSTAGSWSSSKQPDLRHSGAQPEPEAGGRHSRRRTTGARSCGGPIMKDRLWFFGSYRASTRQTAQDGIVANANAGDADAWDWAPDNADQHAPRAGPPDDHRPRSRRSPVRAASGSTRVSAPLRGHAAQSRYDTAATTAARTGSASATTRRPRRCRRKRRPRRHAATSTCRSTSTRARGR